VRARWTMALVVALAMMVWADAAAVAADDEASKGTHVRGYVTDKDGRTILVEEKPCREDGRVVEYTRCGFEQWRGDKGFFVVTKGTRIRYNTDTKQGPAKLGDVEVGQIVRATYKGPVQESYPSRGKAGKIVILAEAASACPARRAV
jgi:hypothetical protein